MQVKHRECMRWREATSLLNLPTGVLPSSPSLFLTDMVILCPSHPSRPDCNLVNVNRIFIHFLYRNLIHISVLINQVVIPLCKTVHIYDPSYVIDFVVSLLIFRKLSRYCSWLSVCLRIHGTSYIFHWHFIQYPTMLLFFFISCLVGLLNG